MSEWRHTFRADGIHRRERRSKGTVFMKAEQNQDAERRCPSSGKSVGKMLEIWGSDEWNIECPTCGAWWSGGSTVLDEHERR
jgi:hypothetical protein